MITRDPVRAGLAVLGMSIAAAGAVLALNTAQRVNEYLSIRTRGGMVVSLLNASLSDGGALKWDDRPAFTEELADGMKRDYPAIEAVSLVGYRSWQRIRAKGVLYRPSSVMGVGGDYLRVADLDMAAGRFISAADVSEKRNVVVLSGEAASILFGSPQEAVGEGITVRFLTDVLERRDGETERRLATEELQVIGVYRDLPSMIRDQNGVDHFIVPVTMGMGAMTNARMMHLRLKGDDESGFRVRLVDMARARLGKDAGVSAWRGRGPAADAEIRGAQRQRNGITLFFGIFACAVFMVSSVGLMAVMTAEYLEREREIGIRRSLGATRISIARFTCAHAVSLAFIGLVIGVGAAVALSKTVLEAVFPIMYADAAVFKSLEIPSGIAIQPVAVTCALASASAFFAGLFPVVSILRARPAENLRG